LHKSAAVFGLAIAACAGAPGNARAQSHFSGTIGFGAVCIDALGMSYYRNYLTQYIGQPARHEQGAYWWASPPQVFGQSASEVFIADEQSRANGWVFIGVVFSAQPKELALAIAPASRTSFWETVPGGKYSPFVASGGAEILWQGQNAKLLCKRPIGPGQY
jgi:hypothetical protein